MTEENEILRFLLPDLLGKPDGYTDNEGRVVFPKSLEIPANNLIFFIPIEEWKALSEKR